MDSFNIAVWIEPKDSSINIPQNGLDFHLNIWRVDKNFIDLGLIFDYTEATTLCVHIPFKGITPDKIKDLSETLHDQKMRNAIFNEFVNFKTCDEKLTNYYAITRSDGIHSFCLYPIKQKIKLGDYCDGTLLSIELARECSAKCQNKCYIRFRISSECIKNLFMLKETPESKFECYTVNTEFVDLRVNNVRSLHPKLVEEKKKFFQAINSMQCFLMCDSSKDISLEKIHRTNVRILEKNIWSEYISPYNFYNKKTATLAYHWKVTQEKENFSFFVRIKSSAITFMKIAYFFLILFIIGVFSSCTSSYFQEYCKDTITTVENKDE